MRGEGLSSGARRPAMKHRFSLRRPQPLLLLFLATLLTRSNSVNAQSCDPDADATYTAAVLEYSPPLGVTLENVQERFSENVQNYVAYAKEAKRQGAEIVAFPECGLATLELPRLPDSSPAMALVVPPVGSNPCIETDVQHAQELRDLSCAARDSAIYIVVNLPELEHCFPTLAFCPECPGFDARAVRSGIVSCNMDGKRYFNTDVAFDRKGTIVARYRKYNLFGEAGFVPPAEPPLEYFDADFGVRFGLFTCFDIMFETPAVTLVTEAGVTDVIFPTAWFSELPFLTAVQAQASWAWVLDVNLLGAGYNLPEVGSTGTGLYAGRQGKVVATMERERTNKLLVGRLPNRNACSYNGTAATPLSGKIVVLSRKADPPIPKPLHPQPPLKCENALQASDVKIPSLYQCHLQSLLALEDGRRLINPQTGEEADDAVETVKFELHYQRRDNDDEAEVRADEEEFKEVVKPRRDGEASLIYGPRYRQYIQDVMLRGMRRLQDKSDPSGTGEGSEFDITTGDQQEESEYDNKIAQDADEFDIFEEESKIEGEDKDESKEKEIPTLEDTVDTMRDALGSSLGSQAVGRQEELDKFTMNKLEEEVENQKLREMKTPPLNDTLHTMMDQTGGNFMQVMFDELEEGGEKKEEKQPEEDTFGKIGKAEVEVEREEEGEVKRKEEGEVKRGEVEGDEEIAKDILGEVDVDQEERKIGGGDEVGDEEISKDIFAGVGVDEERKIGGGDDVKDDEEIAKDIFGEVDVDQEERKIGGGDEVGDEEISKDIFAGVGVDEDRKIGGGDDVKDDEEIAKDIFGEVDVDEEEREIGGREEVEGEIPESVPSPICQCMEVSSLHEPSDEPSLAPSVKTAAKKPPSARRPISPVAAPGGVHASSRGWHGALIGEDDGYLYLKTEDLSNYVTLLLPANEPEAAFHENSSVNLCHESFCCHFQIVMTVVDNDGMTNFQTEEHHEPADPINGNSHCAGCTSEEDPYDNGYDAAEMSLVKPRRRSGIGGPLAKSFVDMEGEEEDYVDDEEDDDDVDDDPDDEDEVDLEEMEPTEDEYDDDEDMDISAEFGIDNVLLKASGIGHWQSPVGTVDDAETVDRADMEPSEDAIRAKLIADKREELKEELGEMEAALADPEGFAPDSEIEERMREIQVPAVEREGKIQHEAEEIAEVVEEQLEMVEGQPKVDEGQLKVDEGPLEMDEGQPKVDEGQLKVDEGPLEMDEGQHEMDEGQHEMDEGQHEMDEGQPRMAEEPEEPSLEALPEPVPRGGQRYFYRAVVFNGLRTFDGITDGGLQVCAVIPCTGTTMDTCGKMHQEDANAELITFPHVRISGRFSRVHALPLPSTLDANLMPLAADTFSLTATVRRKETDIVMETHKPVSFLTFGIYNRNFAIDPERTSSIG